MIIVKVSRFSTLRARTIFLECAAEHINATSNEKKLLKYRVNFCKGLACQWAEIEGSRRGSGKRDAKLRIAHRCAMYCYQWIFRAVFVWVELPRARARLRFGVGLAGRANPKPA
jgi:hypothetical protein